jgi:hypothetical protein
VTPEGAFRYLRYVAVSNKDGDLEKTLAAAQVLEQFILALEPDKRRRALARAAQRSQYPSPNT